MFIIKITGGLGNQLFGYAMGRALGLRTKSKVKFDISGFSQKGEPRIYELNKFNIRESIASESDIEKFSVKIPSSRIGRYVKRIANMVGLNNRSKYIKENGFHYQEDLLQTEGDIYFDGYWQTEKYFSDFADVIRREFTLKNPLSGKAAEIAASMQKENSLSVHIRRGDYVLNKETNKFHGTCSPEYYEMAMEVIAGKISDLRIYVFSDDTAWVKENIKFSSTPIFVSDLGFHDYEELMLMSYCKHNIIANSSFSWWGAWLNRNPNKIVIAPKKWFNEGKLDTKDLLPESWIKL